MYTPVFLALTGSRLYGTNRPDSDYDYRGIVLGNKENYLGMLNLFESTSNIDLIDLPSIWKQEHYSNDIDFYEIGKYIKLAWDANPNILELLFAENILKENKYWNLILEHRDLFISKKCLYTFSGYAMSQFKRLRNHNRWVNSNIEEPKREDFNLPEGRVFNKDVIKALANLSNEKLSSLNDKFDPRWSDIIKNEIKFSRANQDWKNYQTWKKNRNPARFELEFKWGYDTKHAAHLVRLFYECKRLLETGKLVFPLPELDILLDVLNGKWSYDKIVTFSEEMDSKLKEIADKSNLPNSPDRKKLDSILQDIRLEVCNE